MSKKENEISGEVVNLMDILTGVTEIKEEEETPTVEEESEESEESEEEEEEIVPTVEEEEIAPPAKKDKKAEPKSTVETDSYKTIKRLIDAGIIEDFPIQLSDDEADVTNISDFTSMDDEQFNEIIELHKEGKIKDLQDNYLPKDGLKPHQIKVIEILKNGGDFTDIGENAKDAVTMPFEGYDSNNKQQAVNVLFEKYMKQQGLTQEDATDIIKKRDKAGTLYEEAQKTVDQYQGAFNTYLDDKLEAKKKDKLSKDSLEADNKKAFMKALKDSGLKESAYKKVADEYGRKDSSGESALIAKLKEILSDPEKNHSVITHLIDPKSFEDIYKIKNSNSVAKTIQRLATGAGKQGNRQTVKPQVTQEIKYDSFAEMFNQQVKETNQ